MKTTKHNLNAIAMGVALAMGSVSALAAVPANPSAVGFKDASAEERASLYPTFESSERTGIALVESALSLIAARTHIDPDSTCAEKTYSLAVDAGLQTEGSATINDGVGGTTTLHAELDEESNPTLGAFVKLWADKGSSLAGSAILDYDGDHQWSRLNHIFLDHATWHFIHPQSGREIFYDEHSIKDYYKRIETVAGEPEAWEYDWGFEVITKEHLPVAKWTELSWYRQQDGVDGILKVRKDLLAPSTKKSTCKIVAKLGGFVPFEYSGTVTVSKP